jgi:hypothetical protein
MMTRHDDLQNNLASDKGQTSDELRQETLATINRLQSTSIRGLWALALFIIVSMGAMYDFSFIPSLPPDIKTLLGRPPSINMISGALILYSFSAIILILARMMGGSGSYSGFAHVGYLAGFYIFYHFSKALEDNFWAVFVAGLTILCLESYHIWTYCTDEIRKEQELLTELERKRAFWSKDPPC